MNNPVDSIRDGLLEMLPRLRRFGRSLTRNHDDADELVQLAIERALRKAGQWRPGSRLDHWMMGIMRNAWIDEIRSRQRKTALFAPAEAAQHAGESPMEAVVQSLDIEEAMSRLPDEQRTAIALVLVEGLSYREAAELLEVPIGTLTSRLARGRATLQALLESEEESAR